MDDPIILIHCTVPSADEAKKIAHLLVEKRMAACCSIIANVTSVYRWQDKVEETKEVLLLIKSSAKIYEQLEKEIKMIHSYTVPEILAIEISEGSSAYIDWIRFSINQ
jgi:periplasmic divalent cation tolerance protein